jgi:hypothetical protein
MKVAPPDKSKITEIADTGRVGSGQVTPDWEAM